MAEAGANDGSNGNGDNEKKVGLGYLAKFDSKETAKVYRSAIKAFLMSALGRTIPNGEVEGEARAYFSKGRNYQEDVDRFVQNNRDKAPKTRRFRMSAVKICFEENGIELPPIYWKRLGDRIKGSRPLTMDRAPSNAELKKIVNLLPLHGKALVLMLASGGLRVGEALQLMPGDVDLASSPAKITIRGGYAKSGNIRITFISSEAKEMLEQWLKVRPEYLQSATARSWRHRKDPGDQKLFPFRMSSVYAMWGNALRKAGLEEHDSVTKRQLLHVHCLRKYFRSKLGAVIPVDIVEALMGHEAYLAAAYRRYSAEDLGAAYKKGEHSLSVMGNGAEVSKLKTEIEEKSKVLNEGMATLALKNQDLENKITALFANNEQLSKESKANESKLRELEANNQSMKREVDNLIDVVDRLVSKVKEIETKAP